MAECSVDGCTLEDTDPTLDRGNSVTIFPIMREVGKRVGQPIGRILIFALPSCGYCRRAKALLRAKDVQWLYLDVQENVDIWKEISAWLDVHTVPQIFFNDRHIGGFSELSALEDAGELDALLLDTLSTAAPTDYPPHLDGILEKAVSSQVEEEHSPNTVHFVEDKFDEILRRVRDPSSTLKVKNRWYHLHRFKRCFVGKDMVTWLASNYTSGDRLEAVKLGQSLLEQGMFHHVVDEHGFKDEKLFYRFQADEKTMVLNVQRNFEGESRSAASLSEDLRQKVTHMRDAFIREDGTSVDYEGIRKSDHLKSFIRTATELQLLDLASLSNDEKKAMFINLYNSLVIHGFIAVGPPTGVWKRRRFFKNVSYNVGGHIFSLNDIENGILRGNKEPPYSFSKQFSRNDPRLPFICTLDHRIHFALVCGAKSCPPIKVFSPENIDEGLDLAARGFCEGEVEVDESSGLIRLSSIIKWYRSDFGKTNEEALRTLCQYLSVEKRQAIERMLNGKVTIKFKPYNWDVNS